MIFTLEKYKGNAAFLCENRMKVLYDDILALSQEVAAGIGHRRLILMTASNSVAALMYYLAFLCTENVVILLPQEVHKTVQCGYIGDYHPDYICCHRCPTDGGDEQELRREEVGHYLDYSLFVCEPEFEKNLHQDLALLLPTSGSTGHGKLVRQSRQNIIANAQAITKYLEISEKDRPIMSLPMSYTYGLSVIHSHIMNGASILLPSSRIYQKNFWTFFQENRGTSFSGVPYIYEIIDKMRIFSMDLPHLNCLTQAGGRLSESLQRRFAEYARQHHIRFYVMYGQTEATARMAYLPYEVFWSGEKINSIGIPIPDTQIKLFDGEGQEVTEPYRQGEITFFGENVSLGYARDYKDLAKGNENQFRLKTGDIAYADEDGFYYICGRKSRFIKLLGKRIHLDDIENMLQKAFPGISCAAVGNDRQLAIWLEEDNFSETDIFNGADNSGRAENAIAVVKEYLQNILRCHASLIAVNQIGEFPRSASGKILYAKLEEGSDSTGKQVVPQRIEDRDGS